MAQLGQTKVPLLASLNPGDAAHLLCRLPQRELPPNAVLFHEGDFGDSLFIVLEGQIDIIKALGSAEERLLISIAPGGSFGEICILDPQKRRTASAVSRADSRLAVLSRSEFDTLLCRWPTVAYDLARALCLRLRDETDATIRDLKEKNFRLEKAYEELQQAQVSLVEKERIERELRLAWEIQQSMLPREVPSLRGFEFGARIVPARVVGGDFYDFIPLDADKIGIAVGDVSGKGLPAAMFMATTRTAMRVAATQTHAPEEALLAVNNHLLEMSDTGMFVTLLYGVLDRNTGRFDYGRAGHEVPLVCEPSGCINPLLFRIGQPLGIVKDPAIDRQRLTLVSGQTLLVFTDGATDAIDESCSRFGLQRLRCALAGCCRLQAQAICDHLIEQVMTYQKNLHQHDDVTLVAVTASSKE